MRAKRTLPGPGAGALVLLALLPFEGVSTNLGSCAAKYAGGSDTIEPSRGPLAFVVLLLLALVLRRRKIRELRIRYCTLRAKIWTMA